MGHLDTLLANFEEPLNLENTNILWSTIHIPRRNNYVF